MTKAGEIRAGAAFVELYLKGGHLVEQGLDKVANKTRNFAMSLAAIASISNITYGHSATAIRTSLMTIANTVDKTSRAIQTTVRTTAKVVTSSLDAIPKSVNAVGKSLESLGTRSLVAGLFSGGVGVQTMSTFMEYERQMARVKALTGASGAVFEEMENTVRHLGRTTQYTTAQVGEGMAYLAMAGLNARDSIDVLPTVLDLATAAQMDLGRTADIVTDIGLAFGYMGKQVGYVSDVLAQASTNSNTTVEKMGTSFKYLASFAVASGQSIEDMATALALLAQVGIKAHTGGTNLREAMINMITPAKRRRLQETLGVDMTNARGQIRPFFDIVDDIDMALSRLRQDDQLTLMTQVFGKRGGNAMLSLTNMSKEARRAMQETIRDNEGATKKMADIMRDSLWGSWKAFVSVIQDVQIAIGDALVPAVRGFLDYFTKSIRAVGNFIAKKKESVIQVSLAIPALIAAGAASMMLGKALSTIATIMTPMVGAVTGGINAIAIAIVGVTSLTGLFTTALMVTASAVQSLASVLQSMAGIISITAITTAGIVGVMVMMAKLPFAIAQGFIFAWSMLKAFFEGCMIAAKAVVDVVANTTKTVSELSSAGASMISSVTTALSETAATAVSVGSSAIKAIKAANRVLNVLSKTGSSVANIANMITSAGLATTELTAAKASAANAITTAVSAITEYNAALAKVAYLSVSGAAGTAEMATAIATVSSASAKVANVMPTAVKTAADFGSMVVSMKGATADMVKAGTELVATSAKITSGTVTAGKQLVKLGDIVTDTASTVSTLGSEATKAAATTVFSIKTMLVKLAAGLVAGLLTIVPTILMLWSMVSLLKAVFWGLVEAVKQLAVAFVELAKNIASALGTALLGSLKAVGTALGRLFMGMKQGFDANKPAIIDWKNSLVDAFNEVKSTFESVVKALQSGKIELAMQMAKRELQIQLISLGEFANDLLRNIWEQVPVVITWLGEVLTEMFENIGQIFTDLWTTMKQEFRIMTAQLQSVLFGFLNKIVNSGMLGTLGEWLFHGGNVSNETARAMRNVENVKKEVAVERARALVEKHWPKFLKHFDRGQQVRNARDDIWENDRMQAIGQMKEMAEKFDVRPLLTLIEEAEGEYEKLRKKMKAMLIRDAPLGQLTINEKDIERKILDTILFSNLSDRILRLFEQNFTDPDLQFFELAMSGEVELPQNDQIPLAERLQGFGDNVSDAITATINKGNLLIARNSFENIQKEMKEAFETNNSDMMDFYKNFFQENFNINQEHLLQLLNSDKLWEEMIKNNEILTIIQRLLRERNEIDKREANKPGQNKDGKTDRQRKAEKKLEELISLQNDYNRWGIGGELREQLEKDIAEQRRIIQVEKQGRRGMNQFNQPAVASADAFDETVKEMKERNMPEQLIKDAERLAKLVRKFHEHNGRLYDAREMSEFRNLLTLNYMNKGGWHKEHAEFYVEEEIRGSRIGYLANRLKEAEEKLAKAIELRSRMPYYETEEEEERHRSRRHYGHIHQIVPYEDRNRTRFETRADITGDIKNLRQEINQYQRELNKLQTIELERYGLDSASFEHILNTTTSRGTFSAYEVMRGGIEQNEMLNELREQTGLLGQQTELLEAINENSNIAE